VILGLIIGFGTKEIIFLVFDEGFDYSIIPLQILLFGAVIRGSITQPIGGSLTGIGRPDLVLKTTLIMAFSNLSLGVLLIPRYGIIGAAIATSLALIIGSLLYLFLVIRYLSFDFDYLWFLKIGGIAVLALILQIISFILINNPLISGSIVVFLTIFMIYTLQLTPNDKKFFISLIHSLFDRRR
ncbi:MAG: polysaccharide biosynthesis C-terminal domain-containing protein, partial [Candidatus Hodarchaeota archaeon]